MLAAGMKPVETEPKLSVVPALDGKGTGCQLQRLDRHPVVRAGLILRWQQY